MKTVNLKKILLKYPTFNNQGGYSKEHVLQAMKEACRQTLELAAENTTICLNKYSHGIIKESINLGQEICTERQNEYYECDKNSILNTINQIR
jgi:hypothetical protein